MSDARPAHLLICFDGSVNSERALNEAARLFPHGRATIAYAWQPEPVGVTVRYGPGVALPLELPEEAAKQAAAVADELAARGAIAAHEHGLDAESRALATDGPPWKALLALSEIIDADVVVAGTRGLGGIKSMLLGSTSSALAHHGTRPLLIIPPA